MNEVRLDPQQAPARAELLLAAGFGQEAQGLPPDLRPARERGRRRRRARAVAEDRRGPDAAARGERGHRQALGQRVWQPAPRHAGHSPGRPRRSARGREGRRPRRPRVARLPSSAERTGRSSTTDGSSTTRPTRSWSSPSCGRRPRRAPPRRCAAPSRGSPATRAEKRSDHAVARWPGDGAAGRAGEAPVASGTAAVAARPRAERRPSVTRLTSPEPTRAPRASSRANASSGTASAR